MKLPIEAVVHLLHQASYGTLATHAAQIPGYPYATVVPNVVDERHRPLLLVSALAEHTRNLLADGRVSFSAVEADTRNVQAAARLTLIGDVERFDPDAATIARYLRYQPDAERYLELDFMFFRILPKRVRYIAGLGRMGWIEATDFAGLPSIAAADEAALRERAARAAPAGVSMLGIDCLGIDYAIDGVRARTGFSDGPLQADDLADTVDRLAPGLGSQGIPPA